MSLFNASHPVRLDFPRRADPEEERLGATFHLWETSLGPSVVLAIPWRQLWPGWGLDRL